MISNHIPGDITTNDFKSRLKTGVSTGIHKAWRTFLWMLKIVIPVSFLVTLLQWSGWLDKLDFLLNPLMGLLNLPSEAALPIISGMLINIYAVIAILGVIPFTVEQMTLIAIFNLIAHSLILEGIIQHKSGVHIIKASIFRISVAIVTVLIVSKFFDGTSQNVSVPVLLSARTPLLDVLQVWARGTLVLLAKIFGLVMIIMVLLESSRSLGWINGVIGFFKPVMKILGLSERVAMMWVAGIFFGLFYSGAIIVEEAKSGNLTRDELEHLHFSLGTNHAVVEDVLLFAMFGINILWLLVPRFIMSIFAVQGYHFLKYLKNRKWQRVDSTR